MRTTVLGLVAGFSACVVVTACSSGDGATSPHSGTSSTAGTTTGAGGAGTTTSAGGAGVGGSPATTGAGGGGVGGSPATTGAGGAGTGGAGTGGDGSGGGGLCAPGATESCYDGPQGTEGIGVCAAGTHTCNPDGNSYGPCTGEIMPAAAEDCATPEDDDCDGQANEPDAGCVCTPGTMESCYDGPAGTEGVGICVAGTHTCNADGMSFGACTGEVTPAAAEDCATPEDDDCNGQANDMAAGCQCAPGTTQSCYDGPAGTQGVGVCAAGTQTCNADGKGFGACTGEITPAAEDCATALDENCDGQANEAASGCVCAPGATQGCYDGPAGTEGVGICAGGTQTCAADGKSFGPCAGEVTPAPKDDCITPVDDNCNGQLNEGCMYPSCKAIHGADPNAASGLFTIDADGPGPIAPVQVYCDMETDGGGWTLVGRSAPGGAGNIGCIGSNGDTNFGWTSKRGSVVDDTKAYSLGAASAGVAFTEILFGSYSSGKTWVTAYRQTVGADFIATYSASHKNFGPPTPVLGVCTPNAVDMFTYVGFTSNTDTFHFRDVDGNGFGLTSTGWYSCYADCGNGGNLHQQAGMVFVR